MGTDVGNSATFSAKNQILYMLNIGEVDRALELYEKEFQSTKTHDFEVLEAVAVSLLREAHASKDPEKELMAIFGAAVSAHEKALFILEEGLSSQYPQLQIISLNFLANQHNDRANELIEKALSSPYLLIRLEALYHVAKEKHPHAAGQAEALMAKTEKEFKSLFPKIFAEIGGKDSIKLLRKLMSDPDEKVRIEAILSSIETGRDDLLPQIRMLVSQAGRAQQEAAIFAIGAMKDLSSVNKLEKMKTSSVDSVQLAAHYSLYQLGIRESGLEIQKLAREGNVFAIERLKNIEDSEDVLYELTKHANLQVRINATFSLLERQDSRCISPLLDILLQDARDLAFVKIYSQGRALSAYKVIPSGSHHLKSNPIASELSVNIREYALQKARNLPEKHFLKLCYCLFEYQQNDLVPLLVSLLENLGTPGAIELLKVQQQKVGAPLIRQYCTLALYRLKIPGPYAENMCEWVRGHYKEDLIRFRPFIPWEMRLNPSSYQLTPEETSRLLIESIEALARAQDRVSLEILIEGIRFGNEKNKYALAGLLIRALQ